MQNRILGCVLLSLFALASRLSAQDYSEDARKIALGGEGDVENVATKMIDEHRPYFSIVLPFGFIQVLGDLHRFDPRDDEFDPVRTLEYASSPLHYVFERNSGSSGGAFVEDLVNGTHSRDLNTYRGFLPANELVAEGLDSPNWGKTFKFRQRSDGTFHGIYVGAGPYVSVKTALNVDQGLTDVLGSEAPVYVPNSTFSITNESNGQVALAVTGGYRGRIAWPGRARPDQSSRDGIYIGANYHYLRGFRYGAVDIRIRFDTDSAGLVTLRPVTTPAVVDYLTARSGHGFALDFGLAAVLDCWEFGFGVNGVANRIEWQELERKRFTLQSLGEGGDYIEQRLPAEPSSVRVELPVNYMGNAAYHQGPWSVLTEVSHGFQGLNFHAGVERRFRRLELRGGGRYSRDRWHPAGGFGFNLSQRVSLDLAAFGTSANIQLQRKLALAVSFRLNRKK